MENKRRPSVQLWKKESGNFLSHRGGLTEDQVAFLQTLKVGDRLILFVKQRKDKDTDSDAWLTQYYEMRNEI